MVVIRFVDKEDLVLCQSSAFLLSHNFLINILVSLLCKHEVIAHFLKHFCKRNQELVLNVNKVCRYEFSILLQLILYGFVD